MQNIVNTFPDGEFKAPKPETPKEEFQPNRKQRRLAMRKKKQKPKRK